MKLHRRPFTLITIGLCLLWALFAGWQPARAQTPAPGAVVRAVLFYSPTCSHCHYVISEVLPPLFEKYGAQLEMIGIDISQESGDALLQLALKHFGLDSTGVPFLVVGDVYLTGSAEIPEKFPGLIDQYLVEGGMDWPVIPGLAEAIEASQAAEATAAAESTADPAAAAPQAEATPQILEAAAEPGGMWAKFALDPLANSIAVAVLAGMLLSVGGAAWFLARKPGGKLAGFWGWAIPVLCFAGLGVASYLAYVETTQVEAICGPVGDCEAVHSSPYARLFGVLPVGILGMAGYGMILLTWFLGRSADRRLAAYSSLALLALSVFGLLFSIYLTFLEPFVIGATCAWCLTSALLMTAVFWLSLGPGKQALKETYPPVPLS